MQTDRVENDLKYKMEQYGLHYIPSSVNEPVQETKVRRNKLRHAINTYQKDSQSKVEKIIISEGTSSMQTDRF